MNLRGDFQENAMPLPFLNPEVRFHLTECGVSEKTFSVRGFRGFAQMGDNQFDSILCEHSGADGHDSSPTAARSGGVLITFQPAAISGGLVAHGPRGSPQA